jgi:hypothetical protein
MLWMKGRVHRCEHGLGCVYLHLIQCHPQCQFIKRTTSDSLVIMIGQGGNIQIVSHLMLLSNVAWLSLRKQLAVYARCE